MREVKEVAKLSGAYAPSPRRLHFWRCTFSDAPVAFGDARRPRSWAVDLVLSTPDFAQDAVSLTPHPWPSSRMAPNLQSALKQLEALANDKVRALNIRNGAGTNQFGVKLGDIRKVAATLKSADGLPNALWATGNLDARLLAVLLIKPAALTRAELDRMVRSVDSAQLADWLQAYVTKVHPEHEALRQTWMRDTDTWARRAGWSLTAGRVARSPDGLDLTALLDRIEGEMGGAVPEVQWTMNTCLANIGIHHAKHRSRALAIGEQIGAFRDYPVSKGCTSPFAPIWITEMVRRNG